MPEEPSPGEEEPNHRKEVKHFEDERCVHELTFSCFQRRQLLTDELWLRMLSEAVTRATERHKFDLLAFVWMPEHVHMLVLPRSDESSISALLKAIKRPFSYRIKQLLIASNTELLKELTVRQRPGKMTFRFWQEGPGFDRNMFEPITIEAAIDYIHRNPFRRELCEKAVDWKWSSARHFILGEHDPDLPRIDPIDWQLFG